VAEGRRSVVVAEQDERIRRITALAQHLLSDLARHGYGERLDLDYLTPGCRASVQRALSTVSREGWRLESDYGETVFGTAYLPEADGAVHVELVVDDRSLAREPDGHPVASPSARWLLELELDAECRRITNLSATAA
jgi:hypothetical protein